jgi:cobalt-precorrin-5B (C1)-methyltransferase
MKNWQNSDRPLWNEALDKPPRPRRNLRPGFSTGTAAAAAAQAALRELLEIPCPPRVEVPLPGGGSLAIALYDHRRNGSRGEASVIKDAGDDPDVTHGAQIGARLRWLRTFGEGDEIVFLGGEGVGRVTKPGLPVAVGEPAINPVPRKMIRRTLSEVWEQIHPGKPLRLEVELFVSLGAEIARRTLNPRLGILGGISILGTTGLVKPFSHEAYRATILASLRVARALGRDRIIFTTGGQSEELIRAHFPEEPDEAFVQMADYVRFALRLAGRLGFPEIVAAAFFGKALKIAQGFGHTHASRGLADLAELGRWTKEITGDARLAQAVARANTGRQALEILTPPQASRVIEAVGRRMLAALREHAGPGPKLTAAILDFGGSVLWWGESRGAR